jgi:PAS domain S-box-containing protein
MNEVLPGLPALTISQLRAILDAIPARITLLDRQRRHRYINLEYARFAGRPEEEILGRTVAEILGAEAYGPLRHYYEQLQPHSQLALAGEASQWEGWLPYSGHGEPCFVQRFYLPHRNDAGEVDGYFILTRDLTELKRGEALNAAIIASALDCIIVVDENGDVVEFNPAAERVFGIARNAALGHPIADLIVPPALRERHAAGFRRYLETGQATMLNRRIEIEAMRSDGTIFPVELALAEVRLAERRLFTAYLRDLTASRAAAAQIARQQEALAQSERLAAFGSLLAGVAHELNNPLSIVLGGALMLEEEAQESANATLAEEAERIRLAADRCARIVRSFLAMARQQAARRQTLDVVGLIQDALQLLAYGLRSDGIAIETHIQADLPKLLGDPDQLQQVLANLITNARQAMEHTPPPRRLMITACITDAAMVKISVADNGPGVPPQVRPRIFDPFFTTKPIGVGTGIGLPASRGIAEAHGGSLALADQADTNSGACFVLRLPAAPTETVVVSAALQPPASASSRARHYALIVDDEPDLAHLLAGMLKRFDVQCDFAATGRDAQDLLRKKDYHAILCDLRMPDMDGEALFNWIKVERPWLCARTGFITGDALGRGAGLTAQTGRPVLEKPFLPDDVHRLLAVLLTDIS